MNEINVGVIGAKPFGNNDSIANPTFKEFYKINLNTNKLLIIKNPTYQYPLQQFEVKETTFSFSTNHTIEQFIKYANKTKSVTLVDYSQRHPVSCDVPPAKPVFFEFRRSKYSKLYIIDFENLGPELRQLYFLLVNISKTSRLTDKSNYLKINEDSLYSSKAKYFKVKFETPPPRVQKTIKFTPPPKKK